MKLGMVHALRPWVDLVARQVERADLADDNWIAARVHPADDVQNAQDWEMTLVCLVPEAGKVATNG